MLCSFLLIPYQSLSNELSPLSFDEIMGEIKSLHQKDLLTAIKLAKFYEKYLPDFQIEERILFKKNQAELYSDQTEYNLAEVTANEGLELTKQLSHPSITMAELLNIRGYAIERNGNYNGALLDYIAALEVAESLNDREIVIITLTNLGAVYYILEKYKDSIIVLNDALKQAQVLNDDKLLGLVYIELGALYYFIGVDDKVIVFNDKALTYFNKANENHRKLNLLQSMAVSYGINNQYVMAIELYNTIIIEAKKVGNFSALSHTYSKLASAYIKKTPSDPNTAYRYIILAEKYLKFVSEIGYEIFLIVNKADVLNHLELYEEGLDLIVQAEKMLFLQPTDIKSYVVLDILSIKSELLYNQGLYQEAYQAQYLYHENILEINNRNNFYALEDTRIKLESQQHEIQAGILKKKRLKQSLALSIVNVNYRARTFYIIIGILTILGLVCFYLINLKNQKKILNRQGLDHLTALPNRQSILSLGSTGFNQAGDDEYSTLIIEIDNFTNINRVKGYDIGSSILMEVSLIIMELVGDNAKCGRYSSNEFIVFLSKNSAQENQTIANKVDAHIYKKSWDKYGVKVVSINIGISHKNKGSIDTIEALVKMARMKNKQTAVLGGNTL